MTIRSFYFSSIDQKRLLKGASTFCENVQCSIAYLHNGISSYAARSRYLVLPFAIKSFLYPESLTRSILQNCDTSLKQQTAMFNAKIQHAN